MKRVWWVIVLVGVVAIIAVVSRSLYRPARNGDDYFDRRALIEKDAQEKCSIAEERSRVFKKLFPRSTDVTKTQDPEKTEWEPVQSAQRDCKAVQALLDPPLPIETYELDVQKACGELKKRQEAFDRRFPSEESQNDNDAVMNSKEWKELQDWTEGCEQAKAQLKDAKEATAAGNGKR